MEKNKIIEIAIADDHKIFREGLKVALSKKKDLKIIWEAENGLTLMEKIQTEVPDVLLMDIRMPEMDGINALKMIRKKNETVHIIILSMYDDNFMISRMMEMGANGYLTKMADIEEIHSAIYACMKTDFFINETVNRAVLKRFQFFKDTKSHYPSTEPFTQRELDVLKYIAEDKSTDEISKAVNLSPRTIEAMRQSMKEKAKVKTVAGLVMFAVRNKLLQ